jgi:two-component system chemotaxis sensor kinase CheA
MQSIEPTGVAPSVRPAPLSVHELRPSDESEASVSPAPVRSASRPVPAPEPKKSVRRGLSIFQKLLILIVSLVLGVVALLGSYLLSRQVAEMRASLEAKAATYGRLVSKQVESAIAFDDRETAREVFESVAQDGDVESLTLFTSKGTVLRAWGSISPESEAQAKAVKERTLVAHSDRIAALSPVVSLEGPRGTLVVELSTRSLAESSHKAQQRAAFAFVIAALLGALGAFVIARSLGRRLKVIATAADAVAAGDLNQGPVDDRGRRDEIGVTVSAFNAMLTQIRDLVAHIQKSAREEKVRLERLVAERTAELDARNEDMRRVLDNVGQGFLTLNATGEMSRERSRVLETWFGKAPASGSFVEYIASSDSEAARWFAAGWSAIVDDLLPIEVTLDQLPKRVALSGRNFEIEYRPILAAGGKLDRVLLVLSDVTAVLERERAEAGEREATRLFTRLVADRAGFLEFFAEAESLVESIRSAQNATDLVRPLHTLKGNAGIFGIDSVARLCHDLENQLQEAGALSQHDLSPLFARWNEIATKVRSLVGDGGAKLEVSDGDYEELAKAIERRTAHAELQSLLHAWKLESGEARLSRVAEQAQGLAERLGKGPLQIDVDANRLRFVPEKWTEFWSAAVHVVRNAIDHGLETAEERSQAGKPEVRKLGFRSRLDSGELVVEFSDDGRGIDWRRVEEKAKQRNLPADSQAALVDALFADGLSTRDEASEYSGRGVGLSAVRAACQKLGGRVVVESRPGQGSVFRFVWPAALARQSLVHSNPAVAG